MKTTAVAILVVLILVGLGLWFGARPKSNDAPVLNPTEVTPTETVPTAEVSTTESEVSANPAPETAPAAPQTTTLPAPESSASPINAGSGLKVTTETIQNRSVSYTGSSFSPTSLSAKVGDVLTFTNNGSSGIRISSNPHPVHSEHPDFDSGLVAAKATWSFSFTEAGTYNYHNHFNPGAAGSITVK